MDVLGAAEGKKSGKVQVDTIQEIAKHVEEIKIGVDKMVNARKKANKINGTEEKAYAYCDDVKIYFDNIRYHSDKLEQLVSDDIWPLPKLRELLFAR